MGIPAGTVVFVTDPAAISRSNLHHKTGETDV